MPPKWGPCGAARGRRKSPQGARTMRASSLRAHGRALSEPRSPLANSEGRMPGERATGGVFLWLLFFAQAKKVTRSPAGRVEALHFKERRRNEEAGFRLELAPTPALALRASCAVRARSGARSRRNDGEKRKKPAQRPRCQPRRGGELLRLGAAHCQACAVAQFGDYLPVKLVPERCDMVEVDDVRWMRAKRCGSRRSSSRFSDRCRRC